MGRTLKRVPLDFAWPLNKTWGGYLNPHYTCSADCSACDGTGYATEAKRIHDQWCGKAHFDPVAYGARPWKVDDPEIVAFATRNVTGSPEYYGRGDAAIRREAHRLWRDCFYGHWSHNLIQADVDALIAADRLWDFTRTPRDAAQCFVIAVRMAFHGTNSWLPESNGYTPTAEEVNAWSLRGFGHDGSNAWVCLKARCAREGVEATCARCSGTGRIWTSPEAEQLYENWEPSDPPSGDGFQLWETTSEGSPITPVFATIEELCEYAADNCSTFGDSKTSATKWREMLDDDFVCHTEKMPNGTTAVFM